MKTILFRLILIGLIIKLGACTPSRLITPLKKNEAAIGAGLGGPLIKFGNTVIPMPFATLNGGYGVSDNVSLTGAMHVTSAVFGVAQIETGALVNLWKKDSLKQGITFHGNLNTAFNDKAFRMWPQTDFNYHYATGKKSRLYTGVSFWYEFNREGPHGETQKQLAIPSWQGGFLYTPSSWTFQLEAKIIAPHEDNTFVVVDYVTPLKKNGALGVYFTVSKRFGK